LCPSMYLPTIGRNVLRAYTKIPTTIVMSSNSRATEHLSAIQAGLSCIQVLSKTFDFAKSGCRLAAYGPSLETLEEPWEKAQAIPLTQRSQKRFLGLSSESETLLALRCHFPMVPFPNSDSVSYFVRSFPLRGVTAITYTFSQVASECGARCSFCNV
jgi:hypothetical protein